MTYYAPKFSATRRSLLKASGAMIAGVTFAPRFALSAEEKELNQIGRAHV